MLLCRMVSSEVSPGHRSCLWGCSCRKGTLLPQERSCLHECSAPVEVLTIRALLGLGRTMRTVTLQDTPRSRRIHLAGSLGFQDSRVLPVVYQLFTFVREHLVLPWSFVERPPSTYCVPAYWCHCVDHLRQTHLLVPLPSESRPSS